MIVRRRRQASRAAVAVAVAVAMVLGVAGCGDTSRDTSSESAEPVPAETMLEATEEPGQAPEPETTQEPTTAEPVPAETMVEATEEPAQAPEPETTQETTTAEPELAPAPETNARGNIPKAIGEPAKLVNNETGELLYEFTITDIQPNFECTSEYASESVNGHFIAITIDATTTAALAQEDLPSLDLNSFGWTVYSPDGTRENDSVGNSYTCLQESEALPTDIGPGEHAVGKIILDSVHTTGSIAYSNPWSMEAGGWEWGF